MLTNAKEIQVQSLPTGTAGTAASAPGEKLDVLLAKHENRIAGNTASIGAITQDSVTVSIYKVSNFGTI